MLAKGGWLIGLVTIYGFAFVSMIICAIISSICSFIRDLVVFWGRKVFAQTKRLYLWLCQTKVF